MTQQYLIVNGVEDGLGSPRKSYMIKTYSFTTDDDDIGVVSNTSPISNHNKSISLNLLSIDNHNKSDHSTTSRRRKRSTRQSELEGDIEEKNLLDRKKKFWYKKVDLFKQLMIIGLIIVLYFLWIKRDVWMQRLSTSSIPIRRSVMPKNDLRTTESINSSLKEDIIENTEEDLTSSTKSNNPQKINLRVRTNKINLNKERQKREHRHSQDSSINTNKEAQGVVSLLPSSIKTKHQHRSMISRVNHTVRFVTYDHLIKQLRRSLKSRTRNRSFVSKLSKATGLRKDHLYRFIYKKHSKPLTSQAFLALLDSFNLVVLIVPR